MPLNVPILLTWLRIVLIPLFVGIFYFEKSWVSLPNQNLVATVIFVLAAVTDWLDGWLARSLVANAVTGVTEGFKKELDIVGVGYRAELKGKQIIFALGYSHAVVFDIPNGIDVAIDKQTHVTVTGVDRQLVGQVAANIRRLRKPDPYKQKGVR